jgi:hypothetical protein
VARLSPDQLKRRLTFDFKVCQRMFGEIFSGEAYRNSTDLQKRRNPIMVPEDGHLARKYRVDFHVRTLIRPGTFADITTIGFDLEAGNYPYEEPHTWLISPHVPYSPHFRRKTPPVCIGPIWEDADGDMLLGELFVHIARLLNWDGGKGYPGWNPEAVAFYRSTYGERPLTPGLRYPLLPTDLVHGLPSTVAQEEPMQQSTAFHPRTHSVNISHAASSTVFRRRGTN